MDNFLNRATEKLFSRYPQWRGLETIEKTERGVPLVRLAVNAPPEADTEHGLRITIDDREMTIGFDAYHDHFSEIVGDGKHQEIAYAMHFLSNLLAEKVVAVSWWDHETWRGSRQMRAGEKPDLSPEYTGSFNQIRIRSWKGTYNADIKV